MTEAVQEQQQEQHSEHRPNSYEWIRDTGANGVIPESVRRQWVNADNREARLRDQYLSISEDGDLTPEAKSLRAQDAYERERDQIVNLKQETKASLLSEAKLAARRSQPWPQGESREPSDPQRLLLAAQEGDRLVRVAQRRATISVSGKERPNPMFSSTDFLKEKYGEGLEQGGAAGASLCGGVLRACEELGVDVQEVLNAHRDEYQIQQIDNARRMQLYTELISERVPELPKKLQAKKQRGGDFNYRPRRNAPMVDKSGGEPPITKSGPTQLAGRRKAKRPWK
jgi:hypothetical protein